MKSPAQSVIAPAPAVKTFASGLWNVWTRFKPGYLTVRNQVKVFGVCLLIYLLVVARSSIFDYKESIDTTDTPNTKNNINREVRAYMTQRLLDGKQDIKEQEQAPSGEFVLINPPNPESSGVANTTDLNNNFALVPIPIAVANPTIELSTLPEPIWTWECNKDTYCGRVLLSSVSNKNKTSQDVCWLTCGPRRRLWPYPSVTSNLGRTLTAFYPEEMRLVEYRAAGDEARTLELMHEAYKLAHKQIKDMLIVREGQPLVHKLHSTAVRIFLNIVTKSPSNILLVNDESYSLTIQTLKRKMGDKIHVKITANSFFGIRHGLETLTQLIAADTNYHCLQILNEVHIEDKPAYPYRGLLIDTARNFISIPTLKRIIEGMSYNKLNMLHWHMTDSNSFTFYSKSVPKMTQYGAYSEKEIYRPNEIQDLIQYALLRGVKIIPELDAPAHAGNGWQWGPDEGLEQLALCVNYEPWQSHCYQPPCGQLNPVNPNTYDILEKLYRDMLDLFDKDVFHMGGDEIKFNCWETQDIKNWLRSNQIRDLFGVWGYFQWEAFRRLCKANNGTRIIPILWTSKLTNKKYTDLGNKFLDPADYIIQVWDANTESVINLLQRGHALIFSNVNYLYLDWGSGTWLGKGHNYVYINWQSLYDFNLQFQNPPLNATKQVKNHLYGSLPQILGGEAALWSEKVDEDNAEIKIWPRTCALAESLWSNPKTRGEEVYSRILIQSQRMRSRGLRVDRRQPKSCDLLTGHCSDLGQEL